MMQMKAKKLKNILVYLDWDVFDRIEKIVQLDNQKRAIFQRIEQLILDKHIVTPYSNAHINDLLRGYSKYPRYIGGHLEILKKLTQNLCIIQYWNRENVTWHYRDVEDFFYLAIEVQGDEANSLSEILTFDLDELEPSMEEQDSEMKALAEKARQGANEFRELFQSPKEAMLIPEELKEICERTPLFDGIFHKAKKEMNLPALCEDIFEFSKNIQKEDPLYRETRSIIRQGKSDFKRHPEKFNKIDTNPTRTSKDLLFERSLEKYAPKTTIGKNPDYQEFIETYCNLDLRGHKSDGRFSNMIDDALHSFYGIHCDYFITLDDKCSYKAKEVYKILGKKTVVMAPEEFAKLSYYNKQVEDIS